MSKGWGDSDSEDEDHHQHNRHHESPPAHEPEDHHEQEHQDEQQASSPPVKEQKPKTFTFPEQPPFTAYVGNLAFGIQDAQALEEAIVELAEQHNKDIKVVSARVMKDRETQRSRGFGYVEVETLDHLKAFMELHTVEMAGRRLNLDTATQRRNSNRNSFRNSGVDGSSFRGGKFAGRGEQKQQEPLDPNKQRPSFKLKPRSKPLEGSLEDSGSDIFGGGKARDEQSWRERRDSDRSHSDRRLSGRGRGRGGRGGRGRGRGEGRGREGRGGTEKKKSEPKPTPKVVEPEKPKPVKVQNAFAALAMDSDSD